MNRRRHGTSLSVRQLLPACLHVCLHACLAQEENLVVTVAFAKEIYAVNYAHHSQSLRKAFDVAPMLPIAP